MTYAEEDPDILSQGPDPGMKFMVTQRSSPARLASEPADSTSPQAPAVRGVQSRASALPEIFGHRSIPVGGKAVRLDHGLRLVRSG